MKFIKCLINAAGIWQIALHTYRGSAQSVAKWLRRKEESLHKLWHRSAKGPCSACTAPLPPNHITNIHSIRFNTSIKFHLITQHPHTHFYLHFTIFSTLSRSTAYFYCLFLLFFFGFPPVLFFIFVFTFGLLFCTTIMLISYANKI